MPARAEHILGHQNSTRRGRAQVKLAGHNKVYDYIQDPEGGGPAPQVGIDFA